MLHVVIVDTGDKNKGRRVDELLRFAGERVRVGAYEVVGTAARMGLLERELGGLVGEAGIVRIYPVCGRCRDRVRLFGEGDVARLPVAWVV